MSLAGHGAVVVWAVNERAAAEWAAFLHWGGMTYAQRGRMVSEMRPSRSAVFVPPASGREAERPVPMPDVLVEPPPPPVAPPPREMRRPVTGDEVGGGEAAMRSPGEKEPLARQADQAQADLGLLPQGARTSGQGGVGGSPGTPAAEAERARVERERAEERRLRREGEGVLKETGRGDQAGALGVEKGLPAVPRTARALPRKVDGAEVGERREGGAREGEGTRGEDAAGKSSEVDARKVGSKDERREAEGVKGGATEGAARGEAKVDAEGAGSVQAKEASEATREGASGVRARAPEGEASGREEAEKAEAARGSERGEAREAEKVREGERSGVSEAEKPAEAAAVEGTAEAARESKPSEAGAAPANAPQPGAGATGGTGDGRAPGEVAPPGATSVQADTESDPFSRNGSISFRQGRVDARFGRRVRWVRPRFTVAGQIDAATLGGAAVVLAVTTDATGRVTKVEVLQSSGSPDSIDLPVVRAVYGWWIEPPKDARGVEVGDTMVWRIELR